MVQQLPLETKLEIIYPDRDGEPIAENTKQFRWIVTIKENLEIWFASILPKLNNNGSVQRKRSPNLNKNDSVQRKRSPNLNKNDSVIKLCYNKYSSKPSTPPLVINKTNPTKSISLSPVSKLSTPTLSFESLKPYL